MFINVGKIRDLKKAGLPILLKLLTRNSYGKKERNHHEYQNMTISIQAKGTTRYSSTASADHKQKFSVARALTLFRLTSRE